MNGEMQLIDVREQMRRRYVRAWAVKLTNQFYLKVSFSEDRNQFHELEELLTKMLSDYQSGLELLANEYARIAAKALACQLPQDIVIPFPEREKKNA